MGERKGVKKEGREQQLPFLSDQLTWKATLCLRLEAITLGVRFKTFVCQHDRREQGCNLMRGQWEWETLHGQLHAERQREAFVRNVDMAAVGRKASAYRRNISTGIESLAEVSSSPSSDLLCGYCKGSLQTLQPWRKHFHLLPFVSDSSSNAALYCFSIHTNWNGAIVSVHTNVTNTVNMWFKLNLRSNKSARSSRRDISSILAGRIVWMNFQDRKRAACSSPTGRMEHVFIWGKSFRWYIKHQSKVSFPLTFLLLSPSNRHSPLYSAHIHTQDQKQNKQRPFKYQPTCLLCAWRSYCTARPGLVQPVAVTWTALRGTDPESTGVQQLDEEQSRA